MKDRIKIIFVLLIIFSACLRSSNKSEEPQLPNPQIKCGVAKVSGTVKNLSKENEKNKTYTLSVANPITIIDEEIEVVLDENGNFEVEIPLEVSPTIAYFKSNLTYEFGSFFVNPGQEIKVDIVYDEENKLISPIVFENYKNWEYLIQELTDYSYAFDLSRDKVLSFINDPASYIPYLIDVDLKPKLKFFEENNDISQFEKEYLSDATRIFVAQIFLSYHSQMKFYLGTVQEEGDTTRYIPRDLDLSYYVFLQDFDLNNPRYLLQSYYSQIAQGILLDKTMAIPKIGDTPINQWLEVIRDRMTDLLGFDSGSYYDVLVGNAYALQFMNDMKPLSDIQIKNIHEYFRGGEIEKILLRKNKEIIPSEKMWTPTVVNETPAVSKEKLMQTIISNYRGKAVVVDFWATWCGPCLQGITKTKQMKLGMKDKDVVFVYITTESSPKAAWEIKIKEIGGEHYYLNEDEWRYILEHFDFNSIPTYQFYDRNGDFKEQINGVISADTMKEKIELLLEMTS